MGKGKQIVRNCPDSILPASEMLNLKSHVPENLPVFFEKCRFPASKGQDNGGIHYLAGLLPKSQGRHCLFIQDFFVGSVLVNNIQLVIEFYQPISIEKLADQLVPEAGGWFQEAFLKKIHLPGWFGYLFFHGFRDFLNAVTGSFFRNPFRPCAGAVCLLPL